MLKNKRSKNRQSKSKGQKDAETISLKDGWEIIYSRGVQPFLERVENVDDPSQFEQTSIPHDQFSQTYEFSVISYHNVTTCVCVCVVFL